MEGPLKLYKGLIYKPHYCILHHEVLTICTKKGGDVVARLHVGVYDLKAEIKKKLLILSNGIETVEFKAETSDIVKAWSECIKEAQNDFEENSSHHHVLKNLHQEVKEEVNDDLTLSRHFSHLHEKSGSKAFKLNQKLAQVWQDQASLSDALKILSEKIPASLAETKRAKEVVELGNLLSRSLARCLSEIEREKSEINEMKRGIQNKTDHFERNVRISFAQGLDSERDVELRSGNTMGFSSDRTRDQVSASFMRASKTMVLNSVRRGKEEVQDSERLEEDSVKARRPSAGGFENNKVFAENPSGGHLEGDSDYQFAGNSQNHSNLSDSFKRADSLKKNKKLKKDRTPAKKGPKDDSSDTKNPSATKTVSQKSPAGSKKSQKTLSMEDLRLTERVGVLSTKRLTELNLKLHSNKSSTAGQIHPYIQEFLTNEVFNRYPPSRSKDFRYEIAMHGDPNDKMDIVKLIKNLIGKDITKVSLPAHLNQPLSSLIKQEEFLAYKSALDQASKEQNSMVRLGLTLAAMFLDFNGFDAKRKKPINPLLGETHEMFWEDVRVISEQVSHHPPISAVFVESQFYTAEGDMKYKPTLSLKHALMEPDGQFIIRYKKFGDKIIIRRPNTAMYNLFFGEKYFHHFGVLSGVNVTTGDSAEIHMKEKTFFGEADANCTGVIKNARGEVRYTIEGNWKQYIHVLDEKTGRKVVDLGLYPEPPNHSRNYLMPLYTRNAIYLNKEMLKSICPTDSRLRSDQRAIEYRDMDLASDEKYRLEQAQRARRAKREEANINWQPRWFKLEYDNDAGKEIWKYKGGYFEARKAGKWENIPKIFVGKED